MSSPIWPKTLAGKLSEFTALALGENSPSFLMGRDLVFIQHGPFNLKTPQYLPSPRGPLSYALLM